MLVEDGLRLDSNVLGQAVESGVEAVRLLSVLVQGEVELVHAASPIGKAVLDVTLLDQVVERLANGDVEAAVRVGLDRGGRGRGDGGCSHFCSLSEGCSW